MTEMPTISAADLVSILTADNLLQQRQIADLGRELDDAMDMIVNLLRAGGEDTPGCTCTWCLMVDEARNLLDHRTVEKGLAFLEEGVKDE